MAPADDATLAHAAAVLGTWAVRRAVHPIVLHSLWELHQVMMIVESGMSLHEERLFTPGPPALGIVVAEPAAFANLQLQLMIRHPGAVIRMIRGKKCSTLQGYFDEVSAALQFPYYFGENWAAFDECIVDLDWLEGDAYVLLVSDARLLMAHGDEEDLRILIRTLASANVEWVTPNQYIPRDREPTPFHVVFHCSASEVESFAARLTEAGGEPAILEIPIAMA